LKVIGTPKDSVNELNERTKELQCLYQVSSLLNQPHMKLDEIMGKILYLIQSAMEFPSLANVIIRVKEKEYKTQNFKKTDWKISNKVVEGEIDLSIKVYYQENRYFVSEKIDLIEEIAFKLKIFLNLLFQNKSGYSLAKQQLMESERKYKELFNHMTSGVAVYEALEDTTDFIIKDINKAGEKIDKILKKDIINKKVTEGFPGVKDLGLFDVFKRVWKTGIPENHPISLYKDDRVSHWVENYVYKLPSGEIVAVYDDVTEKKIAEVKLTESEEKFRTTFKQAAVGIAHVAPDGQFLRVNQKWCNIVGYTPEEMITKTFQEITHPDDLDADLEFVRQMLDKEISNYSMEKRYFHKDGSIVWINLTVALLFHPSGEPKYFISVIEDITVRKKAEQRFKTIFMNSPIGIELYNSEGKLINANKSCLDIFGVSSIDSVKGFDLFQDPNISEEYKKKLLEGGNIRYEMTFDFEIVKELKLYETSKSGMIELDVSITPLYLSGVSSISNYLVQLQDITERKKAEKDIQKRNREYSALLEASKAVLKYKDFAFII
jgi:PAS domain S-box-containing protein